MLDDKKKIHILAVGGIGMSAIAILLLEKGFIVSGSDCNKSAMVSQLIDKGLIFFDEHEDFGDVDLIVYSSAIKNDHTSWILGHEKNIPFLHRSRILAWIMQGKKSLLVAGCHGKTTTSSLLVHTLKQLGESVCYAVGGSFSDGSLHCGLADGDYFVIEADESDGSFLNYQPYAAIVTNIDDDHLDFWGDLDHLQEGFRQFISQVKDPRFRIICSEDPMLVTLGTVATYYGCGSFADFKLYFDQASEVGRELIFLDLDKKLVKGEVGLSGHHNALNALGVFTLLRRLGFEAKPILEAFSTFKGVQRRCQEKGTKGSTLWIDDYGHHPTEIKATLKGLKEKFPSKTIKVVFQPHRFSRTYQLWNDFKTLFNANENLIVTDIYGFGEDNPYQIHARQLASDISAHIKSDVKYVPRHLLKDQEYQEDIILTFGAGDICLLFDEVSLKT